MQVTSGTISKGAVVFDAVHEDIPGGLSLDKTRLKTGTTEIKAGTPVYVNKTTRVAEVVKSATVITGGSSTAVRVATTHQFIAGEAVTDGLVSATISSITAGTTYDTLNLGSALAKYAAGDVITECNVSAVLGEDWASGVLEGASGHTLTITDPTGNSAGLKLVLARAADDNLAVAYSAGVLTVTLANSTAAKNTAALIQTAIRALITGPYPFGSFICVGASWSEDGSTLTTASATMTANQPYKYLPNGFVKETVNVEYDNADCSVVVRGTVRESALPFPLHANIKAKLPMFNFNV